MCPSAHSAPPDSRMARSPPSARSRPAAVSWRRVSFAAWWNRIARSSSCSAVIDLVRYEPWAKTLSSPRTGQTSSSAELLDVLAPVVKPPAVSDLLNALGIKEPSCFLTRRITVTTEKNKAGLRCCHHRAHHQIASQLAGAADAAAGAGAGAGAWSRGLFG